MWSTVWTRVEGLVAQQASADLPQMLWDSESSFLIEEEESRGVDS